MILVDASVWIDHFRRSDAELSTLLSTRTVLCHPFVIGELACGHLSRRDEVLASLADLPTAPLVAHADVMHFVASHASAGRGIGWVDAHLLASAMVARGASLWSRDERLAAAAAERGVGYPRTAR